MTPRSNKLLAMTLGLVAITAAAWIIANRRAPQSAAEVAGPAVPGLLERMPKLDKVVISTADGTIATLLRGDDRWTLEERSYPADETALRSLLLSLGSARQVEGKTSNPALYDRLGVEPMDSEEARGTLVELQGGGDPIRLIFGDNPSRGEGTYLRGADEAQSWLVDKNLAVERQTASWLDRSLTDIKVDRIASLRAANGEDVVEIKARNDAAGDFEIANLPKGREPASDYIADSVAGWLQDLRMEDVAADDPEQKGVWTLRFDTVDGLVIESEVWKQEEKSWARFWVSLDDSLLTAAIDAEQAGSKQAWEAEQIAEQSASASSEVDAPIDSAAEADVDAPSADASADEGVAAAEQEELAPSLAEAPLSVRDPQAHRAEREQAIRAEFDLLKKRFEGRQFQIPAHKAANVERKFEDYLKPKG